MVSVETGPRPNGPVPAVSAAGLLRDAADDKISVKNVIADSGTFLFCVDSGFVSDVMVHDALGLTDYNTDGPTTSQRGNSFTFMTGVIMSGHFLRPPNMLTKFFKDPKYVDQIFRNPPKLC